MENMVFYDFSRNEVIDLGINTQIYPGCYFDRAGNVTLTRERNCQNNEWYIQQKINDNSDGYFDFTKNMIDVGAYIGIYRWNLPFNKAWLFEPNRESYMYCCANAVLHNLVDNTFIYNEILSNRHETIEVNGYEGVRDDMGGAKGMNGMFAYLNDNTTMISKTLDDFLPVFDNIGFIKVDCEGMDWKVIEGGRKTIELFGYPPILFENWPPRDDPQYPGWLNESEFGEDERNTNIRRVLKDMGYEILWGWGNIETHLAIHKDQ